MRIKRSAVREAKQVAEHALELVSICNGNYYHAAAWNPADVELRQDELQHANENWRNAASRYFEISTLYELQQSGVQVVMAR